MLPEEIILAPVVTEKSNDELQQGKYTFKVKAKNIYGVESSIAEYSFIVRPPFFRSMAVLPPTEESTAASSVVGI